MSTERDDGQMMLLAAVVLIVAFLSLTVLVARIGIVEAEIGRDTANTLLLEADVLEDAICLALDATATQADLATILDYVSTQLIARGVLPDWDVPNANQVSVTLTDGRSRLAFSVQASDCL